MAAIIEWPLESLRNIHAALEPSLCHCFSSHPATTARAADEVQRIVFARSGRSECRREPLRELGIDPAIRKRLPLQHHDPAPKRCQIGNSNEGPLGLRAYIDQSCRRVGLQTFPGLCDRDIVDVDNFLDHSARPQRSTSRLEQPFLRTAQDNHQ